MEPEPVHVFVGDPVITHDGHRGRCWFCSVCVGGAHSLADFEEDFLKHQNRAGAAQDGERLTRKHGVGHARHGRPEQRLDGALPGREGDVRDGFRTQTRLSSGSGWSSAPCRERLGSGEPEEIPEPGSVIPLDPETLRTSETFRSEGAELQQTRLDLRCWSSYDVPFGGLPQQPPEGDDRRHAGAVQEEDGRQALQTHGVSDVAPQERSFPPNVQNQTAEDPAGGSVSSAFQHLRDSPEPRSPARPLELRPRVMLRLLHRLRVVGGAVGQRRDLPLLLQRRTGVCLQHRSAAQVQVCRRLT